MMMRGSERRYLSRFGTFAGFSLLTITTGCAEDPVCAVTGVIDGDVNGEFAWAGIGHDECNLYSLGVRFSEGDDELDVYYGSSSDFTWKVGLYDDIDVTFSTASNSWSSSDCAIAVDSVTREDWTRNDYLLVTGRITCPPLTNFEDSTITLLGVGFTGYLVEKGAF